MTVRDLKKLVQYWLNGSKYDLATAKNLKKSKRYPYALFFLHLAIEKFLKAIIVSKTKDHAPYSHNLIYLLGKTDTEPNEKILSIMEGLSEFNMRSRYPDEEFEFYKKAGSQYTEEWFKKGIWIIGWLKEESKEILKNSN